MSYQKNKEQYPVSVLAFDVAINEVDSSVIAPTDDECVENVILPTIEPMDIDEYEDKDEDVDLTDLPAPKPTASEIAKRILNQVLGTKLKNGYASFLLEQDSFQDMVHVSMRREIFPFFSSILNDTVNETTSKLFDNTC